MKVTIINSQNILIFYSYFIALKFKKKTALLILKKKVSLQSMGNTLSYDINFIRLINRLYCEVFSFNYTSTLNSDWLTMEHTLESHTRCVNELCRICGKSCLTKKTEEKQQESPYMCSSGRRHFHAIRTRLDLWDRQYLFKTSVCEMFCHNKRYPQNSQCNVDQED